MRMMYEKNDGFTLVELVVAIVIFGIITMAMVGMVQAYQNYFDENRSTSYDLQNANLAMMSMIREMRTATNVSGVSTNGGPTIIVRIPNEVSGSNDITYTFENNMLRRNGVTVTDNVAGNFSYSNNTINITMTVMTATKSGKLTSVKLQDSVRPRNIGNSCF